MLVEGLELNMDPKIPRDDDYNHDHADNVEDVHCPTLVPEDGSAHV